MNLKKAYPRHHHSVGSIATIALELGICGLMASSLAIWYANASVVTQDSAFVTRSVGISLFGGEI